MTVRPKLNGLSALRSAPTLQELREATCLTLPLAWGTDFVGAVAIEVVSAEFAVCNIRRRIKCSNAGRSRTRWPPIWGIHL
jgi:hypothetical protein